MSSRRFKKSGVLALGIVLALLIEGAVPAFASNGKKYFKEGIQLAENKQWDKAAERLALAVAEEPSNAEYQMHLQRALVNAAILFVERGDHLAAQKDYNAAYSAYRQACAFDVTNEVAAVKMRHMLEAQGLPVAPKTTADNASQAATRTPNSGTTISAIKGKDVNTVGGGQVPTRPVSRLTKTDVIIHNGSLLGIVEQIAQTIHLNVAFDQQVEAVMKSKLVNIELRDVTAGEALEIILQINNLMYVQVGVRTIVITMDTPQSRARYEPMSVRTFYIKNADINDLRAAVMSTIGTKQIVASKQQNALVVRDSRSNLDLIDSMIASLDKSKAEVLIDVNLYEISKNDLLQLGNQLRTGTTGVSLSQFGGINQQSAILGTAARTLTGPFGFALGMPSSTLSLFQDKGKAKLLASTQVHVLDNEQHQVRIGQRVPVKTGTSSLLGVSSTTSSSSSSSGLTALDTIQYENVGLNIDMQPQVFEDEVQVKMKIESSSVDRSTGDLTPSFNQRTMSSVARIKDGQTTMIAGISRTEDSREVKGIPIIGLIPILGRFFTTPSTSNQQSDVVITVTPHILRRADITNDDHLAKDAGRGNDADRQLTIQQIINIANETENTQSPVAVNTGSEKSVPLQISAGQPSFPAPATQIPLEASGSGIVKTAAANVNPAVLTAAASAGPQIERRQVASPGVQAQEADDDDDDEEGDNSADSSNGPVEVSIRSSAAAATIGQDFYVAVNLNGDAKISSATIALDYDANLFEVKNVANSGLLRGIPQFTAEGGRLMIRIEQSAATGIRARGQLLLIALTAKAGGRSPLNLNGATALYSSTGQTLPIKLQGAEVAIK